MPRKIPRLAQTKIRLPTALRRDLQREADRNKRPLNAEIIRRLEQSLVQESDDARAEKTAQKTLAAFVAAVTEDSWRVLKENMARRMGTTPEALDQIAKNPTGRGSK